MGALETVKLRTLPPPFSISSSPLVSCVKVGSTISLIEGGDGGIIIHHKKEGKKRNGIQTTTFWDDCTNLYHFNSVQHVTFGAWCAAAAAAAAWPLLSMDAVLNHWGEKKVAEYMPALSLRPLSIDTFLPRERSRVRARLPFWTFLLSHSALVLSCIDDYCLLGKRVKTAAAAAMTTKWGCIIVSDASSTFVLAWLFFLQSQKARTRERGIGMYNPSIPSNRSLLLAASPARPAIGTTPSPWPTLELLLRG